MKSVLSILALCMISFLIPGCTEEGDPNDLFDDRDQFLGTWDVSETRKKDFYSVTIIKDPSNSSQVLIRDFYHILNCTDPPYGIVTGSSIYLPTQGFCDNSFEVNGSGKLNKNQIEWTYTVNDGSNEHTYTAIYTKQ